MNQQMNPETEKKIGQLQMYEQSIQQFLAQKNQFQSQLMEVDSALAELKKTDTAYKIIGNIMVLSEKDDLKKDLDSKKEMLELRIKTMEKQESQVKEKTSKLQSEILTKLNPEEKK
tara:strand:+ start:19697 stop:20044 length:348 start_codon:yes stop_codon:yes gene_type:complete